MEIFRSEQRHYSIYILELLKFRELENMTRYGDYFALPLTTIYIHEFRELDYMVRYGDSFALPLTKLKHLSGKHKTPGHEHMSGKYILPFIYDGPPPSNFCTVGQLPHTVATTTSFVPPSILTDNPSSGESLAHSIAADDQGLAVREDLRRAEEA